MFDYKQRECRLQSFSYCPFYMCSQEEASIGIDKMACDIISVLLKTWPSHLHQFNKVLCRLVWATMLPHISKTSRYCGSYPSIYWPRCQNVQTLLSCICPNPFIWLVCYIFAVYYLSHSFCHRPSKPRQVLDCWEVPGGCRAQVCVGWEGGGASSNPEQTDVRWCGDERTPPPPN